jgi:hypothetical protein
LASVKNGKCETPRLLALGGKADLNVGRVQPWMHIRRGGARGRCWPRLPEVTIPRVCDLDCPVHRGALAALWQVDGRNIRIELRLAAGHAERFPELAQALVVGGPRIRHQGP